MAIGLALIIIGIYFTTIIRTFATSDWILTTHPYEEVGWIIGILGIIIFICGGIWFYYDLNIEYQRGKIQGFQRNLKIPEHKYQNRYCSFCGKQIAFNSKFCKFCGNKTNF
jgi:hypothetical protein